MKPEVGLLLTLHATLTGVRDPLLQVVHDLPALRVDVRDVPLHARDLRAESVRRP